MGRDLLLAASLVFSSASQLRIPGLPAGPGEILLGAWLSWSSLLLLANRHTIAPAAFFGLAAFWTTFAFALSSGAFVGFLTEDTHNVAGLLHDASAYLLMVALTLLAVAERDAAERLRRTAWLIVAIANAAFAVLVTVASGWISLPGLEPWYWDRFRGWSENPNQLALYCAAFGPLALHLGMTSERRSFQALGCLGALLPLVVGRLTKSDTFVIATAVTLAALVVLRIRAWLLRPMVGKPSIGYALAIGLVVLGPPLAISLVPFGRAASADVEDFAKGFAKDKGGAATERTAALRFNLWEQAFLLGVGSGSIGLGPGAHLERPVVVQRDRLPAPFEAHSTLLDLYTQGGLPAVLCLGALAAGCVRLALRARLDALVALIAALGVFSVSHFILRHPIVWFALTFALAAGGGSRPRVPVGRRT